MRPPPALRSAPGLSADDLAGWSLGSRLGPVLDSWREGLPLAEPGAYLTRAAGPLRTPSSRLASALRRPPHRRVAPSPRQEQARRARAPSRPASSAGLVMFVRGKN